jgi:concentrative nucleoside transporter, CNT family
MHISGAEAVVAAASPFLGIGESAMLVQPFLPLMTRAEMHQVMASGLATVAGSVLYAYIAMGVSGKVVVSSCVMSIPAAVATSKLRYPETEEPLTRRKVEIPADAAGARPCSNWLQALSDGTWMGVRVAGIVCGIVLVLVSVVALVDGVLAWAGGYVGIEGLTLAKVIGYPLIPIVFLCGVTRETDDILRVAELLGTKIGANEFVAVCIGASSASAFSED